MKNRIRIAIFITGLSGFVGQMILLRELLIVFSGNELSIGIILANWLILEAFGSFLVGRKADRSTRPLTAYVWITLLFAVSLPTMLFLTRLLRMVLGISIGQGIGILPILYGSLLILLPVSLFHGALFTFGCKVFADVNTSESKSVGKAYVLETMGTIAGGVIWTFLLIRFFHSFSIALGISTLNVLVCLILLMKETRSGGFATRIPFALSMILLWTGVFLFFSGHTERIHQLSIDAQWAPQHLVNYQNSQYSNIAIIEKEGQYTYFLDGVAHLITPIPDISFVEEFTHLPLMAHSEPKNLLVLSGGAGGIIHQALQHPTVKLLDYAELDPVLLDLLRRFPTDLTELELTDNRVNVQHVDGRLFLKTTDSIYDIILIGVGTLSDLQTNRFYTHEFFTLLSSILEEDGIIAFSIPGSMTFLSNELRNLNASVYHTARLVFPYVRVIPGEGSNLFLASASNEIFDLDIHRFAERVVQRELRANITVPRHIENKLHPGWIQWFERFIEGSIPHINQDFRPIGVFYYLAHWNTLYNPELEGLFHWFENLELWMILLVFVGIYGVLFLVRRKKARLEIGIPFSISTTGFSGMVFDLALIFSFQALYGYVFAWIGLLVSVFMLGSALGAIMITSLLPRMKDPQKVFLILDACVIGFSLLLPLVFFLIQPFLTRPGVYLALRWVILTLSLISGCIISAQFPLANHMRLSHHKKLSHTAGLLYGSDLLGGWFGGLIGGVLLLPVLGLAGTCMVVAMLKVTSFIVLGLNRRQYHREHVKEGSGI